MRFRKKKKVLNTWHNGEIPARLFFEILETGKVGLLVKYVPGSKAHAPTLNALNSAWSKIYDEFFTLKDDRKLRLIIKTKKDILQLYRTIETIRPILWALSVTPFSEDQLKEIVEQLVLYGININLDNPISGEIHKALTLELGGIETRLKLEEDNLKNLNAGEKQTFEDNCVQFEEFEFRVDENVSLRRYVSYEKAVIRKAKRLKNKSNV